MCPDPTEYCNRAKPERCVRGCSGRGTCVNNTCQVCSSDIICSSRFIDKPVCLGDGTCAECDSDSNCNSTAPFCVNNKCQLCTEDEICSSRFSAAPYCLKNGTCAECVENNHCPGTNPYCFHDTCQKCSSANNLCHSLFHSALPICLNNGTCVQCLVHSDCPLSDQFCFNNKCETDFPITLNPEEIEQTKQLGEAAGTVGSVSDSGGLANSFLSPSDPTSMNTGALAKMLQYIKFMSVRYPAKMQVIFMQQVSNTSITARVGESLSKSFVNRPLPNKFDYYHVKSSFFVNFWQSMLTLLAIFGFTMLLTLLSAVLTHHKKLNTIVKNILSAVKWNVFLIVFCGTYGDIVFYSSLEFYTVDLDDVCSIISFFVCLGINCLAILVLLKIIQVNLTLKRRKERKIDQNPEKDLSNYKAFFECYKDKSFDQQIFLAIYILRVSLFNMVIAYMYKSPLTQAILILLLNLAMVIYLIKKKPMKKLINFFQQLTLEAILLVFNLCVLILAGTDRAKNYSVDLRNNVGEVMTAINLIVPIVSMGFIAVKILLILKELYQEHKLSKKASKASQLNKLDIKKVDRPLTAQGNLTQLAEPPLPNITLEEPQKFERGRTESLRRNNNRILVRPQQFRHNSNSFIVLFS